MEEKETRPRLPPSHLSNLSMNASIGVKYKVYKVITPWNIGVSTKHILSIFDDGNRVTFPVTPAVKFTV